MSTRIKQTKLIIVKNPGAPLAAERELPRVGGYYFVGVFADGGKAECSVSYHDPDYFFESSGTYKTAPRLRRDLVAWFPSPNIDAHIVSAAIKESQGVLCQ